MRCFQPVQNSYVAGQTETELQDGSTAPGHSVDRERQGSPSSRAAADISAPAPASAPGSTPMDLRVGQRLVRPGSDTAMLTPLPHPLLLSPFSPQPCSQYSQLQLNQHIQLSMEQQRREEEKDKQQKLQQLWNKGKAEQSAVASSVVKQRLQEVILKKQKQAALERTNCNPLSSPPPVGYRELVPDPSAPPQSLMVVSPTQPPSDPPEDPPLRRAASEPNLKVRNKLKNHLNTRKSPLTRKESAPPSIKHRVPDPMDSSPSSSSTPVSGCSSPNDSLPTENGVLPSTAGLSHEAQRLLLQDGTVAHFTVQSPSTLPTITLGLPANTKSSADVASMKMARVPVLAPQVYLPLDLDDQASSLSPCLQPVLIVEPSGLVRTPLLTVPGLGQVPLQFAPQLDPVGTLGLHKPISRTRSEPLPQSPRPLPPQLLQQQHSTQFLERLKQQTHLGKLMTKSSEKPRLRQIPSEDMDSEDAGPAPADIHQTRPRVEPVREAESRRDTESSSAAESQGEQFSLQHTVIRNQLHRRTCAGLQNYGKVKMTGRASGVSED
ncbi:histone deacetylase 7 isoform X1 [Arapaima gigas]